MVTRLNSYLDSVSSFENLEIGLISFSPNPLRVIDGDVSELMDSIRQHGLLEPIIVRPKDGRFEVVAGNRRLRACRLLKHRKVKCVIAELDDTVAYEISIIENVQRKTLDPLEEATAFKKYCGKYGWGSQSELARKIGKSQEYISHRMRLLDLPEKVKKELRSGNISPTAAQELVWLKEKESQASAVDLIETSNLDTKSVRKLVSFTNSMGDGAESDYSLSIRAMEEKDEDRSLRLLCEAILVLRVALARLDGIVLKTKEGELKEILLSKRAVINGTVDELIRTKKIGRGHLCELPTINR
jgi:ParB family chromosome partitioning protein